VVKRELVVIFLALVASAVAVAAPPIPVTQRKFDHDRHINAAKASGKSADCKDCHRMDANGGTLGGKEHTRCGNCHTFPSSCSTLKQSGPKGPARVCETCHVAKRKECLPDDLPPPPKEKSFGAKFTHGKHLALGTSIEKDCVQCHQDQAPAGAAKMQAHKSCSGCHNPNGAKPVMSDCFSCHTVPQKKTGTPPDPYRLTGFDHKNHHSASQKSATCTSCHEKLVGAGESALPRPSMMGCLTKCHDGTKAFSAVGTKCTKCHRGNEPAPVAKMDFPFLHDAHGKRNVKITECATCHAVEADGRLTAPLAKKDHMPCALSGCHQTEFASRTTKICGVCHDTVAPWQANQSRAKAPPKQEWYESMDHAVHLAKTGTANGACTSCHGEKLTNGPKPGSHDGCVGCHGKGQAPAMGQCGGCHLKDQPQRAQRTQWAVTAQFERVGGHQKHAVDKRSGKPAACLDCHPSVAKAKTLAQIKPSTMMECDAACHNGKTSFKTTGFECAKCHSAPKAVSMVGP
jgi:hypothetical protein